MKAYTAKYVHLSATNGANKGDEIEVLVGANSLRAAAVKAEEHENANGKGELTSLVLTDEVIL